MSDYETERRTSRSLIGAAVVVALVVVALVVVLVARLGGNDEDGGTAQPTTSAPSDSDSACGLEAGPQGVPTTAPEAEWELVGTFAVPTSPEIGPGESDEGIASCFAHSVTGAVFAAVNYLGASTDPSVDSAALVRARAVMNEAAERLLQEPEAATDGNATYQLAGFRVADSTPDRATIDLVVRSTEGPTSGQLFSLTFTLAWTDGDWRVAIPDSGQPPTSAVSSLAGYVEWSGA